MKKILLTTAIASLFVTSAIAQTTITGELRIGYKAASTKKNTNGGQSYTEAATGGTTYRDWARGLSRTITAPTQAAVAGGIAGTGADTLYGFSQEAQVNVQTKGKLNVGGLDYAAGFSFENDGDQLTTMFNENTYVDLTNAASGTTISFSRDHIQRSDSDRSAAVLFGHSPNDLSQVGFANTTLFQQNIGAAPGQVMGVAVLQKTPIGTFSYNFAPENNVPAVSEDVNQNTKGAYEYGFLGDFGVKGLEAYYFQNADIGTVTTSVKKAEGKSWGVKYNMGQFSVGYADKIYNPASTNELAYEVDEKHFGAAYAINNALSLGVIYAKADVSGAGKNAAQTETQKVKAVQLGYGLGPADLTVSYAKNTDMLGVSGNDTTVGMVRIIGKF